MLLVSFAWSVSSIITGLIPAHAALWCTLLPHSSPGPTTGLPWDNVIAFSMSQEASRSGLRGKVEPHTHVWVPGEVIEDVKRLPRPDWGSLQEMPFSQFLHGLRQRNWTSKFYDPASPPWKVQPPSFGCG